MTTRAETQTAKQIRAMARMHHVVYTRGPNDELAHHITRLAGDVVQPDEIEQLLFALQRAGHLTRVEMVRWQALYLREIRP
jgi:thymidylate kinase